MEAVFNRVSTIQLKREKSSIGNWLRLVVFDDDGEHEVHLFPGRNDRVIVESYLEEGDGS